MGKERNSILVWVCAIWNTFVVDPIVFLYNTATNSEFSELFGFLGMVMALLFTIYVPIIPEIFIFVLAFKEGLKEAKSMMISVVVLYSFVLPIVLIEGYMKYGSLGWEHVIKGNIVSIVGSVFTVTLSSILSWIVKSLYITSKKHLSKNLEKCSQK